MEKIKIYTEFHDGSWQGYTFSKDGWRAFGLGDTKEDLTEDIKSAISWHQEEEGKEDPFWGKVDLDTVGFEIIEGSELE